MTIRKVSQLNAKSVFSMTFAKTIIFCDSYPSMPSMRQRSMQNYELCELAKVRSHNIQSQIFGLLVFPSTVSRDFWSYFISNPRIIFL